MKRFFLPPLLCIILLPAFGQSRSFNDLFPGFDGAKKEIAFSAQGLSEYHDGSGGLRLMPQSKMGRLISDPVMRRSPSFVVESISVLPYKGNPVNLLKVYNALGKVRALQGREYFSDTRGENIPLFENAARIESPKKISVLNDPPDVRTLPGSEIVYLRLKDANFGNSYYQANITINDEALLYSLSNFRNLTYGFITVIKENNLVAQLYVEPLSEGLLVYSIAAASDISNFISSRIHIPSAIEKRLKVIVGWMVDGIFTR